MVFCLYLMPTARRAKRKKPAAQPRRFPPATSVAVGDEIHVLEAGLPEQYKRLAVSRGRSVLSGIVCSIRNVKTGKLVPKAAGRMSDYVLEILDTQTFDPAFSSARNTGGPAPKQAVAQAVKKAAQAGRLMSDAAGSLREGPLARLDGWRIVKFVASEVYTESPLAAAYSRKAR